MEFARHVGGISDANSEEFMPECKNNVIYLIKEWFDFRTNKREVRDGSSDKGGTMRLGAYPCVLKEGSKAYAAYMTPEIFERHRHRYEFNNKFKEVLEEKGLVFSGTSPDSELMEIIEIADHPWFVGCQFHPEFKSNPMKAHPLFRDFIAASIKNK
jgi:CTP synthase